ncbi:MAG TPA: PIN domain-containing protein [Terriglobales bacterium]
MTAFLIDTCVWIDVERGALGAADVAELTRNQPVFLTPVTLAALSFGAEMASDADIRQRRRATLARMRNRPMLPIGAATGMIFGSLASQIRSERKQPRHRIQDLWQASLAIEYACPILTRNGRDFADVPGLDLVTYALPTK